MGFGSMVHLLAIFLAFCLIHGHEVKDTKLPGVLLDKASPLSDASAAKVKDQIQAGGSISTQLCEESGFSCGHGDVVAAVSATDLLSTEKTTENTAGEKTASLIAFSAYDQIPRSYRNVFSHQGRISYMAAVFFFNLEKLHNSKQMVLPPSTDSSLIQSTKFLHPSLESFFQAMKIPQLLSAMGIPDKSKLALKILSNQNMCTSQEGIVGEVKKCVASLGAMVHFASTILEASSVELKYLMTSRPQTSYEKFKVVESSMITDHFVTCHTMMYPYALYMCHAQPKTMAVKVVLEDDKGEKLIVPAVCHIDTSAFDPDHIAFKVLHSKPGFGEVCHWLPSSLLWYKAAV